MNEPPVIVSYNPAEIVWLIRQAFIANTKKTPDWFIVRLVAERFLDDYPQYFDF